MQIELIKTENLFHHPDNPRTGYKDIEELTASVSEKGILQPLTVVRLGKYIDRYNVVAGNRRLEAAKAAGLKECPCIVSDMDEKEQASIMLIENMQRKDLNPYEQGKGVQMCLDLGMTETEIAKKTGFSRETIRHRKKLAELDQDRLKDKCKDGQISIQELVELEKIKDITKRNEVLEKVGTANFSYSLTSAIRDEQAEADRQIAYGILITFAEEMPANWADNSYRQDKYGLTGEFEKPEDADTADYAFKLSWSGGKTYSLYKRREDVEEEEAPEASPYELNRTKQNEAVAKLKELAETFYEMRKEHMLKNTEFNGNAIQWLTYLLLQEDFSDDEEDKLNKPAGFPYGSMYSRNFRYELYAELMGDKELADEYAAEDVVGDMKNARYVNHADAAAVIYSMIEVGPEHRICTWQGAYDEDLGIDEYRRLYDFMELCGYELSDAEKQILDGTHEAYYRED